MDEIIEEILDDIGYDMDCNYGDLDFDKLRDLIKKGYEKQFFIHVVSITLLKKYMNHVINCEGVDFVSDINRPWSDVKFTKKEKELLEVLKKEIDESN